MPASDDIKQVITDFVNFDVKNNYYQKQDKEDLVANFKKILYEDDVTIRKFLEKFFMQTKQLAEDFSLIIPDQGTVEVVDDEKEESTEEESDDEKEEEKETKEDKIKETYYKLASDLIYE